MTLLDPFHSLLGTPVNPGSQLGGLDRFFGSIIQKGRKKRRNEGGIKGEIRRGKEGVKGSRREETKDLTKIVE